MAPVKKKRNRKKNVCTIGRYSTFFVEAGMGFREGGGSVEIDREPVYVSRQRYA